jgi:hypothetical protein
LLEKEYSHLAEYKVLDESGVFNFKFKFQDIEKYNDAFDLLKEFEKDLVKSGGAFNVWTKDLVGTPIMKNLEKIALFAFNNGCELIINQVKYNNYDSCLSKINTYYEKINNHLAPFNSEISKDYHKTKIKVMALSLEYESEKQRVKQVCMYYYMKN